MNILCSRCGRPHDHSLSSFVKRCPDCRKAEETEKMDRSRKKEFIRYMESNPQYFRMLTGTRQKTPAQLFREVIDARIKWYEEGLKEAMRIRQMQAGESPPVI
jgi:hypothetical protein